MITRALFILTWIMIFLSVLAIVRHIRAAELVAGVLDLVLCLLCLMVISGKRRRYRTRRPGGSR
jgi:hypothetical protein